MYLPVAAALPAIRLRAVSRTLRAVNDSLRTSVLAGAGWGSLNSNTEAGTP